MADGDFTTRAAKTVYRADSYAYGVLPGGNNRTMVCKILPTGKSPRGLGDSVKFRISGTLFWWLSARSSSPPWSRSVHLAYVMSC